VDEIEEMKPTRGRALQNARLVRVGVRVIAGSIIGIISIGFILMMLGYVFGDFYK